MPGLPWRALVVDLLVLALLPLTLLSGTAAGAADGADRLERFRELAASRLGLVQLGDPDAPESLRDIYALLDEEIVDNLTAGGPFASVAFLQDRLDAFAEVWGGASLKVVRAGGVLVGAFTLDERASASSLRVYGPLRGEPALLSALYREGRPTIHGTGSEAAPLLVAWEGPGSGWGMRALRVDLLRRVDDRVSVAWSTVDVFPEGLMARTWSVRGAEVRIRYEVRYPGWAPGCDGQTEQEDVYRVGANSVTRTARRPIEPWHRELHATVHRLTTALAARDEGTLSALVPDRGLRGRLPPGLSVEPACDAREGGDAISVAAVADGQRPWALTFRRLAAGWRLTGANPVLQ
jgi:hypothetical protein